MGACGSSAKQAANPNAVDLSHFEVLKVVGKGGFGKVNAIQRRSSSELFALKRMSKCEVIRKESHIKMVWIERNIMSKLNSPFICILEHAFQSDLELFFVMPFMQGGDLRFHLNKRGHFTEQETRFYASQIIIGLEAMHKSKIVYRDLKPENFLLDAHGHIRLSDFGLSVQLEEKKNWLTKGNAGTHGYLAPEVVSGQRYGTSCDIWSFGITLYEMLHGRRPYRQWKEGKSTDKIKFRADLHPDTIVFIKHCLAENPKERIGCGDDGINEIKKSAWFKKVDWKQVERKGYDAIIKPDPDHANCSNNADLADQLIDKKPEPIPADKHKEFEGFEYNSDISQMDIRKKVRYGLVDPKTLTLDQIRQVREERNATSTGDAPRLSILVTGTKTATQTFPVLGDKKEEVVPPASEDGKREAPQMNYSDSDNTNALAAGQVIQPEDDEENPLAKKK